MKQKKINDILYVFNDEPYVITQDTDASVVYVQNHAYDGFKALNPSLNFKKYNYNVFTVKDPEWKQYLIAADVPVNPDPIDPTPTPPTLEDPGFYFTNGDYNYDGTIYVGDMATVNQGTYFVNPNNVPVNVSYTFNAMNYPMASVMENISLYTGLAGTYSLVLDVEYVGADYAYKKVSKTIYWTVSEQVQPSKRTFIATAQPIGIYHGAGNSYSTYTENVTLLTWRNADNPDFVGASYQFTVSCSNQAITISNLSVINGPDNDKLLKADITLNGSASNGQSTINIYSMSDALYYDNNFAATLNVSGMTDPGAIYPPVQNEQYSFISYDPAGTTEYGRGEVTVIKYGTNRTQVNVNTNSTDQSFVNKTFWIDSSAKVGDNSLWPLYWNENDVNNAGISVKIYTLGNAPSTANPS